MPAPDPHEPPYIRICIRCGQRMLGHSYSTLYGYIEVVAPGPTRDGSPYVLQVHSCGEACHHICPRPGSAPREIFNESVETGRNGRRVRRSKWVAQEIFLQENGLYSARVGKKRVGTHLTIAKAEEARQAYIRKMKLAEKNKVKEAHAKHHRP